VAYNGCVHCSVTTGLDRVILNSENFVVQISHQIEYG